MNINGWDLEFPQKESNGKTALANVIESCASSALSKEKLMDWFDNHKIELP